MQDWPQTKTLKSLGGFLGLIGYYHKFVSNYGRNALPLTNIMKKKSFLWTNTMQQAFLALKQAICSTPVLALFERMSKPCTFCETNYRWKP